MSQPNGRVIVWCLCGVLLYILTSMSLVQGQGATLGQTNQMDQQQSNINMMAGPVQQLWALKSRYLKYIGTNLSGGEFGARTDAMGTTWQYPSNTDIDYFVSQGFNIFRIPLRWERMQPSVGGPLDQKQISIVQQLVQYAATKNAVALLDIHNSCRYNTTIIGFNDTSNPFYASVEQYASFFGAFVKSFTPFYNTIWFNVMNEPYEIDSILLVKIYNQAIAAARGAGYTGVLTINGNAWSGCYSWNMTWYGGVNGTSTGGQSNAVAMLNITDPANNLVYDCHNYFNSDNSGDDPTCVNATIGVERLGIITQWLRTHKFKGYIGESGASMASTCLASFKTQVDYLNKNNDVWLGVTWWSAGPKWGNYYASIQPVSYKSIAKNQLQLLRYFVTGNYVGTLN